MGTLGVWITNGKKTPFYARREWELKSGVEIRSAQAEVCGLGQFHFYINGEKVGDHELDPGWTNYRKYIQYVSFDATKYLRPGSNVIAAEVGNGWYLKMDEHYTFGFPGNRIPNPNPYRPFGDSLVLALKIAVTYADGTQEELTADERFLVADHPVVMSNVYGSETIDMRKALPGWKEPGDTGEKEAWSPALTVAPGKEPEGRLEEQKQPPIRVIRTYPAKKIGVYQNREIYDFGQNMSGILEWEMKGHSGEEIRIYPAEKLTPDGDVDQMAKGWREISNCITGIVGKLEEWEVFRQKFTYFAGRYVAVERILAAEQASKGTESPQLRNLQAHAITSAWETVGSFQCDDKRYEQIYQLVERAVEANMMSVHTDCPTIERFAWQEPNHLMAPSIMFMKNGRELWEKFLLDMRTDQLTKEDYFFDTEGNHYYPGEGLMPSQCPCYMPTVLPVPGAGSFYDIIPWGSTCILGTWWHYWFYGERSILEENYEAGMRYLEHLKRKVTREGFINHGLGDWGNPEGQFARENVETAFLYADTVTLERMAKILGREADAGELHEYAEKVKANYNEKLLVWNQEKQFWCYRVWKQEAGKEQPQMTQACQALPLYWGMVPPEKEMDIVRAFRDTLEEKQAFASGEVGLPYIIQSARRYGMNDLIARFILRTEHPSYYAFVLAGETTLGEYWQENPRSHCHDMMGHIIEWYYNGIAGIWPEEAGFGRISVRPYLPETMKHFICSYRSVQGLIRVEVEEQETEILLRLQLPERVEAAVDTDGLAERGKPVKVEEQS